MKTLTLLLCLFIVNTAKSQEWIFEYTVPHKSTTLNSWMIGSDNHSIHSITVSPVKGVMKENRKILIELDENGELINSFQATNCQTHANFIPYTKDRIVTASRRCDGEWVNTFNVFNQNGNLTKTVEFENQYFTEEIIAVKENIHVLRQDMNCNDPRYFHLLEFDINGNYSKDSLPFSLIKDEGFEVRIGESLYNENGDYIMEVRCFDQYGQIRESYSKIINVSNGKLIWSKSYKDVLATVKKIYEYNDSYVLIGRDEKQRNLIITIDSHGNIVNNFKVGRAYSTFIYNNKLFTCWGPPRGGTIFLYEYDLNSGELLRTDKILTEYERVSHIQIGDVNETRVLFTGGCKYKEELTKGFVLKFDRNEASSDLVRPRTIIQKGEYKIDSSKSEGSINVFPNPASYDITFDFNEETDHRKYEIRIFNAEGKIVLSNSFTQPYLNLDISFLSKGIYFFNIQSLDKQVAYNGKMIKN